MVKVGEARISEDQIHQKSLLESETHLKEKQKCVENLSHSPNQTEINYHRG